MDTIYKQTVGVDCGKDELVVCYGQLTDDLAITLPATQAFANDTGGIDQLINWAEERSVSDVDLLFVVEATGVYHQRLANVLYNQGHTVSVVLPSRAHSFSKTLKVRTVTDRTASKALARMGLEKNLDCWHPPHPLFAQLKQLTRERGRLKDQITRLKNRKHACSESAGRLEATVERLDAHIHLCQRQVRQIQQEVKALINSNEDVKGRFSYVCSIDGVGLTTAVSVVSEADGFMMVRNVRQLVSYAGYDVIQKQSGISVRGAARISKQGNSHIRRALYFPAISAVQHNQVFASFYERLYNRHKVKMKAYVAVQRKLLILIYTMWTKQEPYDADYHQKKMEQSKMTAPHELA